MLLARSCLSQTFHNESEKSAVKFRARDARHARRLVAEPCGVIIELLLEFLGYRNLLCRGAQLFADVPQSSNIVRQNCVLSAFQGFARALHGDKRVSIAIAT